MAPGSALLGSSVLDDLLETVDEARELAVELGVRPYRVYTVLRTWSGLRRGEPGATFADVVRELTPRPCVAWEGLRLDLPQSGPRLVERGRARLTEVSLTYTLAELTGPAQLEPNEEWFLRIEEGEAGEQPARYFVPDGPPAADREKTIGWVLVLRRADNSDPEASP